MKDPPATSARGRGMHAEALAREYLKGKGLVCLQRNYRCRVGEIDLVMGDGDDIVFVEVRFRSRNDFGSPAESVHRGKQARIIRAAQHYRQRASSHRERPCRFDVVSVSPYGANGAQYRLEWITDAFEA